MALKKVGAGATATAAPCPARRPLSGFERIHQVDHELRIFLGDPLPLRQNPDSASTS